jgi:hypothetical protein
MHDHMHARNQQASPYMIALIVRACGERASSVRLWDGAVHERDVAGPVDTAWSASIGGNAGSRFKSPRLRRSFDLASDYAQVDTEGLGTRSARSGSFLGGWAVWQNLRTPLRRIIGHLTLEGPFAIFYANCALDTHCR